jgi:CheY-like chemotaxis protein
MAAGLAHDFNNCLSPIIGLSELILSRPKLIDDHDKVLKYVATIHKAGLDAAVVVSRLREYYRDAAGGEEINVVDLKRVVQVQLKAVHERPSLHVLVIDDDETARNLISEYLSLDGHRVDLADGPGAGLRKIPAGRYDLIITDRAMPQMSGDQLALRSKRVAPRVPVLMLTGLGDFMSAADERPEGVDVVVSKPITIDTLRHAIATATGAGLPTAWGKGRHELPTAS